METRENDDVEKDNVSSTSWYARQHKDTVDATLRPRTLDQFQGQRQLKKKISLYIQATKQRDDALDHIFLSGSHGLGKTTLASIIAEELGVDIKITSAPIIEKPKDLIGILSTIPTHGVLFVDEIHRLRPAVEEVLYSAMEDFVIDWVVGTGPEARTVRIPIARFTLIGATTQPGKISAPLHSRFSIRERLDLYTEDDLVDIVVRSAEILRVPPIQETAARAIAKISRGTPRYANSVLRRMRDFAQIKGKGEITETIAKMGARELGIDEHGLEDIDRTILRVLGEDYNCRPVGLKTLAIAVNESPESLEDFWEVYLIKKGFLQRTPQGRQITEKALRLFFPQLVKKYAFQERDGKPKEENLSLF